MDLNPWIFGSLMGPGGVKGAFPTPGVPGGRHPPPIPHTPGGGQRVRQHYAHLGGRWAEGHPRPSRGGRGAAERAVGHGSQGWPQHWNSVVAQLVLVIVVHGIVNSLCGGRGLIFQVLRNGLVASLAHLLNLIVRRGGMLLVVGCVLLQVSNSYQIVNLNQKPFHGWRDKWLLASVCFVIAKSKLKRASCSAGPSSQGHGIVPSQQFPPLGRGNGN